MCPICTDTEESLQHLFTCRHEQATTHRLQAFDNFHKTLRAIGTPLPVIDAIIHGFTQWTRDPTQIQVRALTAGSLRGPDAVLTSAFREQFIGIGWYHMCLGRISRLWASAVLQYQSPSSPMDGGIPWASQLLAALWQYSRALWKFWNEVVHGATVEEQAARQLASLRHAITTHYQAFDTNPTIILPRLHFLFVSRSLEDRLKGSYDTMATWLRSVEEALTVQQHQTAQQQALAQRFFPSASRSVQEQISDTDSTYTYQSMGSVATLSLEPTVATTVTSFTMSLEASSASVPTYISYGSETDSIESLLVRDLTSSSTNNTMSSVASSASDYFNNIDDASLGSISDSAFLSHHVFNPPASASVDRFSQESDDTSVETRSRASSSYI